MYAYIVIEIWLGATKNSTQKRKSNFINGRDMVKSHIYGVIALLSAMALKLLLNQEQNENG